MPDKLYRIPKLKWEDLSDFGRRYLRAITSIGKFDVYEMIGKKGRRTWCWGVWNDFRNECESEEQGIAMAEAEFESRLAACLEEVPDAD